MRTLILAVVILSIIKPQTLYAQSYRGPESIVYNHHTKSYLISNISSGEILQRESSGDLRTFVSGLTSPKGMVIKGDTLFVTDVTNVRGYDLRTALQIFNVPIIGSLSLNDIGVDNSGNLYISDFDGNKIYKINLCTRQNW